MDDVLLREVRWKVKTEADGTESLYLCKGDNVYKVLEGKKEIYNERGLLQKESRFVIVKELDGTESLYY